MTQPGADMVRITCGEFVRALVCRSQCGPVAEALGVSKLTVQGWREGRAPSSDSAANLTGWAQRVGLIDRGMLMGNRAISILLSRGALDVYLPDLEPRMLSLVRGIAAAQLVARQEIQR